MIDIAENHFKDFYNYWIDKIDTIITEQDTRFKLIDDILGILGWGKESIFTEPATESGFIDYLLCYNGQNKFIVEAKKESLNLIETTNDSLKAYNIDGSVLKNAISGLNQARKYSFDKSVPFACLTNGVTWIAFLPFRDDGLDWMKGKAIVFPSLKTILENFSTFYELFSQEGILHKNYRSYISMYEKNQFFNAENLFFSTTKKQPKLMKKTDLLMDLEKIFNKFFDKISNDSDSEMLRECFVETKESKEADEKLTIIANNLLNSISKIEDNNTNELEDELKNAIDYAEGKTVLIIGNKGAGKSTYIDRFFNQVLEKNLRDKCIFLRVDMNDSNGDVSTLHHWLTQNLKKILCDKLFKDNNGYPTFNELKGIFYDEYQRRKLALPENYYCNNRDIFDKEFSEYIENLITSDTFSFVLHLLEDCVKSRKLMPCIVFDNVDQFDKTYQETVFQYSQAIKSKILSFIICPITDRTIWKYQKSGPLQSYITTSFYLPLPSSKKVLEKRINFILGKVEISERNNTDYFLSKGIRLNIKDIGAFAKCMQEIFINTDFIAKWIGQLANHGVRRCLLLTKNTMTSPIITDESLFTNYAENKDFNISNNKFFKALILGQYTSFAQMNNDFIVNLFDVGSNKLTSPFAKVSILVYLKSIYTMANNDPEKCFTSVNDTVNYFEVIGLPIKYTYDYLQEFLEYGLIEGYNPSIENIYNIDSFKITYSGLAHIDFVLSINTYIEQMALTTNMRMCEQYNDLSKIQESVINSKEIWLNIRRIFIDYCVEEDKKFFNIPNSDNYYEQKLLRDTILKNWLNNKLSYN